MENRGAIIVEMDEKAIRARVDDAMRGVLSALHECPQCAGAGHHVVAMGGDELVQLRCDRCGGTGQRDDAEYVALAADLIDGLIDAREARQGIAGAVPMVVIAEVVA